MKNVGDGKNDDMLTALSRIFLCLSFAIKCCYTKLDLYRWRTERPCPEAQCAQRKALSRGSQSVLLKQNTASSKVSSMLQKDGSPFYPQCENRGDHVIWLL